MKRRDKNIIIPYAIYTIITIILIVLSLIGVIKLGDEFRIGMISSWIIYSGSVEFYLVWISMK